MMETITLKAGDGTRFIATTGDKARFWYPWSGPGCWNDEDEDSAYGTYGHGTWTLGFRSPRSAAIRRAVNRLREKEPR